MAGIDTKANPTLTLHEQLLVFFTTKQRQNELDDNYLNHFNSHLKNLELEGREHLFGSPQILKKDLSTASNDEINAEKERYKAMCFILGADETRYGELLDDMKKRCSRDETNIW